MEGIYPLHTSLSPPLTPSGRHAVRLSRFDDPSLTHKGVEKNPQTGKPRWTVEHQAPDWATSRTQSVHRSDDLNLDLGFPQRGKAHGSTCGQPPPQPSRGRPSAEQRPRGRRHGGINMHAIAAVQQIRDPRTPLLEILIPRSGQDHRASTVDPRI